MNKKITPPLKWAGGKRWLVPQIKKIYDEYQFRLVEPFAGGLAVALGLAPKSALLNDINPHLINFYKQLKLGLVTNKNFKYDSNFYQNARIQFNELIRNRHTNTQEAALLFYYLNRTGFNGLCRFNSAGLFNVPFGKYKSINYNKDFSEYKKLFHKWKFSYSDFENLKILKDDFLYIDPPYDVEFTKYSKQDFNWDDQQRLIAWLSELKNPIMISNQATERVLKLYKKAGYKIKIISAPRRISSNGDRTPAKEILATKNI